MIRDRDRWERFEAEWQRRTPADGEEGFRIFEMLLEHARALGVWPPADPLEGIEVDLRIARQVNTYAEKPPRPTG